MRRPLTAVATNAPGRARRPGPWQPCRYTLRSQRKCTATGTPLVSTVRWEAGPVAHADESHSAPRPDLTMTDTDLAPTSNVQGRAAVETTSAAKPGQDRPR